MELDKINSLVELFFEKYKEKNNISSVPFLRWLKNKEDDFLTWSQVERSICIFSEYLKKNLNSGDRCILLSENRPEWLIADLSIMNAGGVTVPLFTTYSEKDYEFIINDCKPKVCVVSNIVQFRKIEKFILSETVVLTFDDFNEKFSNIKDIINKYPNSKTTSDSNKYNKKIK